MSITLAGCLQSGSSDISVATYIAEANVVPGHAAGLALYLSNANDFRQDGGVSFDGVPTNWTVTADNTSIRLAGHNSTLLRVTINASVNSTPGLYPITVHVGDGQATIYVHETALPGPTLAAGVGAEIDAVVIANNGTILYSNWAEALAPSAIPHNLVRRAGENSSTVPLRVYVGGTLGSSTPAPYNASGFVPVIPGLDAALRGMRAGETRLVHVTPAQGFPGSPSGSASSGVAPLAGKVLNILVFVQSVDILPAQGPVPEPAACPAALCIPPS
ncbi:MAG: COG1470 family protein [Thermoplasmatota archaeon]